MPKLIIICGGSGSGKTTFAKKLFNHLSKTSKPLLLSQDTYYLNKELVPKTKLNNFNFDHPMSFDWEWIKSDINKLLKNEPITINEYDYENYAPIPSSEKTKEIDYIIFEGLLSLYDPEINAKSILNIFIDEKADECLIRRIKRDIKERGRELDSILEQWRDSVAEMYHVYVKNLKYKADIICPHINSKNFVNFIENVLEK